MKKEIQTIAKYGTPKYSKNKVNNIDKCESKYLKIHFTSFYDKHNVELTMNLANRFPGCKADMFNAINDHDDPENQNEKPKGHAPGCPFEHYYKIIQLQNEYGDEIAGNFGGCYEFIVLCQKKFNKNEHYFQYGLYDKDNTHLDILLNASYEERNKYAECLSFWRKYK